MSQSFVKLLAPLQHALDWRIGFKADVFGHALNLRRHVGEKADRVAFR